MQMKIFLLLILFSCSIQKVIAQENNIKKNIAQRWMMSPTQPLLDTLNSRIENYKTQIGECVKQDSLYAQYGDTSGMHYWEMKGDMLKENVSVMESRLTALKNFWYQFDENGKVKDENGDDGFWKVDEEKKQILVFYSIEKTDTMLIESCTKEKLVICLVPDCSQTAVFIATNIPEIEEQK